MLVCRENPKWLVDVGLSLEHGSMEGIHPSPCVVGRYSELLSRWVWAWKPHDFYTEGLWFPFLITYLLCSPSQVSLGLKATWPSDLRVGRWFLAPTHFFCPSSCRLIGLSNMGSTSCCQTNRKRDGNTFLNMFAVGLVLLNEHPFLVGVTLGTSRHPGWPGMMIPNDLYFLLMIFLG